MRVRSDLLKTPQASGLACAAGATGLGLVHMAAAGAPARLMAVNALALVLGVGIFAVMRSGGRAPRLPTPAVPILGSLLLATALFGISVQGASRWIRIGGVNLQVSLIVLPLILIAFAQRRELLSTLGVALSAVALALQPDRAMAGVLAAAVVALAIHKRDRWSMAAAAVALPAFAVTLLRRDTLPAVPYVDQILYTAFHVHPLVGIAVVGGTLLLVVPALTGYAFDPARGDVHLVFGATWLGMGAAAALGNYPTPVVGYGASAVLGYVLSLAMMPGTERSGAAAEEARHRAPTARSGRGGAEMRLGNAS
jgi:hypothetical protein